MQNQKSLCPKQNKTNLHSIQSEKNDRHTNANNNVFFLLTGKTLKMCAILPR